MNYFQWQRGAYEVIIILGIAILATILVNGLPFGGLAPLPTDKQVIQQTIITPESDQQNSLTLNGFVINTIFGTSGTVGQITQLPTCPQANPTLSGEFSFVDNIHDSTSAHVQNLIATTICGLEQTKYISYLGGIPAQFIYENTTEGQCGGQNDSSDTNFVLKIDPCGNDYSIIGTVIHEMGHSIENKNINNVYGRFCTDVFKGSFSNGACTFTNKAAVVTIPTINCLCSYDDRKRFYLDTTDPNKCSTSANSVNNFYRIYPYECFPDMLGDFFIYGKFAGTDADTYNGGPLHHELMLDYPHNFPTYYNFAATNFFTPISSTQGGCDPRIQNCTQ